MIGFLILASEVKLKMFAFFGLLILVNFFIEGKIMSTQSEIKATIVYDNNSYDERLKTDWGFSCLIEGLEKTILFDTGGNGKILMANMEKLNIPWEKIEAVVLSHEHLDHTGGLDDFLKINPKVEVWVPYFFPTSFKEGIRNKGARVIEVEKFQSICSGAFSSGVIEGPIREQSLIIETEKGLAIITGCAHPGIVNLLRQVKELTQKNIYLVIGGFHLRGFSEPEIKGIMAGFRLLGVKKVGPTHCSGDLARKLFSEEFKDDFIQAGLGKIIDLK